MLYHIVLIVFIPSVVWCACRYVLSSSLKIFRFFCPTPTSVPIPFIDLNLSSFSFYFLLFFLLLCSIYQNYRSSWSYQLFSVLFKGNNGLNLSRGSNTVDLNCIFFFRFKPALKWNQFLADLSRGSISFGHQIVYSSDE